MGVHVVPLASYLVGPIVRLTLALFMGAVMVVLLMACANVSGLFVSRTFARRQSVAIQIALGAGRAEILRQVLVEAILLALVAGTAGLGLAVLGVKALIILAPSNLPGLQDVRLGCSMRSLRRRTASCRSCRCAEQLSHPGACGGARR